MPAYECVCRDCSHAFTTFLSVGRFEARPRIRCPQCRSFRQTASRSFYTRTEAGLEDLEMRKGSGERRVKRGRLSMSVPCIVSAREEPMNRCMTCDLGQGGIGVFCEKPLEAGDVIELQCRAIWDAPKTGTARWCQKIQPNLYRIGIAFS